MPKVQRPDNRYVFMGIDPGKSGGIAVLKSREVALQPMPDTEVEVWKAIKFWQNPDWILRGVIEQVGGFVKGNPSPGSAMFKFGVGYGGLRMALIAAGIPFIQATPQRWQSYFSLHRRAGEAQPVYKSRIKGFAQQLFPQVSVTLKTCDALLLAEYFRCTHKG